MKSKYRSLCGTILAVLWMTCEGLSAQGHYAKVFKDVTLYFGIETNLPDPNHPITVDTYHTDFEISFLSTGWGIVISFDGPNASVTHQDIPPAKALLYGNTKSRWVMASIPAGYGFLGAKPGQPFWILPQNAGSGALPLGFATQREDTGLLGPWNPHDSRGSATADRWTEVRLLNMHAPADANFALWQADGIHPPVVFMSTHDWGLTEKNVYYISAGSHVHLNWGFTQPGLYALDFRISTVIHCDEGLTADWAPPGDGTLTFYGDGRVDLQDLTWLVAHWGQIPSPNDPNTFMFFDPSHPTRPVGANEMILLASQWLKTGYPGCDPPTANAFDPNDLIKLLNH
jgi:surface-anchored protein